MNLDTLTETDIKGILKCSINDKNIADAVIEFETGSGMGDGYLGATSIVKVTIGNEVLHLFIKSAPRDETTRSALCTKECFDREIYFYEEVFPILNNIYIKHTKKSLNFFPKCYKTSSEYQKEYMVLDNLKHQGFVSLPKNAILNSGHLLMVLEEYAKLHATGFVLKSENPKMFREIHDFIRVDLYNKLMGIVGLNDNVSKNLDFVRPYYDLKKDRDILEKFGKIDELSKDLLHKDKYSDEYATILHTDCWTNNLMFKQNKLSKTPEELKIIDYQMTCINSPVFDISAAFYMNAGSEENLKNVDNYLDYYYNVLSTNITEMKGDPEKLYSRKIFDEHWRKYRCYGMILALVMLRHMLAKAEELPNFAEYLKAESRETAYLSAISAASVAFAVTRACSKGELDECSCDPNVRQRKPRTWQWGGCSEHIRFGEDFSKSFLDSREDGTSAVGLMNLHNNEAGRRVIKSKMQRACKCHGMSGSCSMRVCWRRLPPFREVGDQLYQRYEGASHVKYVERRRKKLKAVSADMKKPGKTDLVYLDDSPDYCEKNDTLSILGTHGRFCNRTSAGMDGCRLLCCGRGYQTKVREVREKCKCAFQWCCNVVCQTCEFTKEEHVCN